MQDQMGNVSRVVEISKVNVRNQKQSQRFGWLISRLKERTGKLEDRSRTGRKREWGRRRNV